jgi:cysteinyl-tRNA synthetase
MVVVVAVTVAVAMTAMSVTVAMAVTTTIVVTAYGQNWTGGGGGGDTSGRTGMMQNEGGALDHHAICKILKQREEARRNKDWGTADKLRDELRVRQKLHSNSVCTSFVCLWALSNTNIYY